MANGQPTLYTPLNLSTDQYTDDIQLVTGLFSNGSGTLAGSSVYTASLSSSDQEYFVTIQDGFIVNFGVAFDIIANATSNKSEVKLQCIEIIKNFFKIEKMQFGQPIFVSQLEYELMNVDGVLSVNYVTITQHEDYHDSTQALPGGGTWFYSIDGEGNIATDGSSGYGCKYNFEVNRTPDGKIVLPASPNNPAVFELKNPNQNIMGVVK